jgi:hypothetical protein
VVLEKPQGKRKNEARCKRGKLACQGQHGARGEGGMTCVDASRPRRGGTCVRLGRKISTELKHSFSLWTVSFFIAAFFAFIFLFFSFLFGKQGREERGGGHARVELRCEEACARGSHTAQGESHDTRGDRALVFFLLRITGGSRTGTQLGSHVRGPFSAIEFTSDKVGVSAGGGGGASHAWGHVAKKSSREGKVARGGRVRVAGWVVTL